MRNRSIELQEINELKRPLREAKMRADFLEGIINVAEALFNIPVRKKLALNGKNTFGESAIIFYASTSPTVWCK
jgi:hypothetical protein